MDSDKMELISGFSSLIAAGAAILTLFTVYVAATQIATRRQTYQLGLSKSALGEWKSAVVSKSIWLSLGITTQVRTPVITFPRLVQNNWEANIDLRAMITSDMDIHAHNMTRPAQKRKFGWLKSLMAGPQPAQVEPSDTELQALQTSKEEKYLNAERPETTWVDFLQVLGIHPAAGGHKSQTVYELQPEPELFNGIVPMRWKGKDFVAVCSMLGFQMMSKDGPSPANGLQRSHKVMELPAVWWGPLGWMQFRASTEGCIVEYRPSRHDGLPTIVPWETRKFFEQQRGVPFQLVARAWLSINILYLGREKGALWLGPITSVQTQRGASRYSSIESEDMPSKQNPTLVPKTKDRRLELIEPNDGLMYVQPEGIYADSRGLEWRNGRVKEYSRRHINEAKIPQDGSLHQLGVMLVDIEFLSHAKDALLMLKPDCFYFCPGYGINGFFYEIFLKMDTHLTAHNGPMFADVILNTLKSRISNSKTVGRAARLEDKILFHTMHLLNAIHHCTAPNTRTLVHLDDVKRVSKASRLMRTNLGRQETAVEDLRWALIMSPISFVELFKWVISKEFDIEEVLKDDSCITISHDPASGALGTVQITASRKLPDDWPHDKFKGTYSVPLVSNAVLNGRTVMKVYLDLLLIYFWVRKLRVQVTSVGNLTHYDTTVPFSITMV